MPPRSSRPPMGVDPELYDMMRQRQLARREHTIKDIGAALKIGEQADYGKAFERFRQKQAMTAPLVGQLGQLEQYYFGKEFEARQNAMNQSIAAAKAAVQAELQKMGIQAGSQQAAAANNMRALLRNMDDNQAEMGLLQDVSPKTARLLRDLDSQGLARPGSGPRMKDSEARGLATQELMDIQQAYREAADPNTPMPDEARRSLLGEGGEPGILQQRLWNAGVDKMLGEEGWDKDFLSRRAATIVADNFQQRTTAAASVAPGAPALMDPRGPEVVELLDNVLKDQGNPAQGGADVLAVLNTVGIPYEVAQQALDNNPQTGLLAAQLRTAVQANIHGKMQLEADLTQMGQELEQVARRTHASSSPVVNALSSMNQTVAQYTQRPAAPGEAPGEPGAPGEAPGAPGVPGAPGAAPGAQPDPRSQNFYDIVSNTEGSAPERLMRMFDAVHEFSDLPPAAQMKADIMSSDKLNDYMQSRGLKDPETAFQLLRRETHAIHRNNRRHDRKAIRKLRKKGAILGRQADITREEPIDETLPEQVEVADRAVARVQREITPQDITFQR